MKVLNVSGLQSKTRLIFLRAAGENSLDTNLATREGILVRFARE
jgi:hypothetical protein